MKVYDVEVIETIIRPQRIKADSPAMARRFALNRMSNGTISPSSYPVGALHHGFAVGRVCESDDPAGEERHGGTTP